MERGNKDMRAVRKNCTERTLNEPQKKTHVPEKVFSI